MVGTMFRSKEPQFIYPCLYISPTPNNVLGLHLADQSKVASLTGDLFGTSTKCKGRNRKKVNQYFIDGADELSQLSNQLVGDSPTTAKVRICQRCWQVFGPES